MQVFEKKNLLYKLNTNTHTRIYDVYTRFLFVYRFNIVTDHDIMLGDLLGFEHIYIVMFPDMCLSDYVYHLQVLMSTYIQREII